MATEPTTVDSPADVPAQLSTSQNINDSQYGSPHAPAVNGSTPPEDVENKHITSVEDQANSADPSVSGGSDNEATRADGSKDKDGDKGHLRTSSAVKKPATFKAVSVNKKFLAAKSGTTSPSPGLGDKIAGTKTPPPGSGTLTSRPRLIAKTGSGTQGSLPKFSSAANGGKPATAPDPSVVWNRNRPPEPKVYTDEELKKYGIHMASRLKEDDASGQNKWADIDDDDDDWAPETITWGDGTKTTLPQHEEQALPAPEVHAPLQQRSEEKPRSPAPIIAVAPPPTKSSGLASGKGLVLKAASQEKPTLVAKPPAPPAPVKSPWAAIPTVERASPVAPEPSQQTSRGPPSHYRDAPQQAPKEIAADDFSRSAYRDGASHSRELFNSNSGLYEPVGERRGSRHDPHARHPAVLQRSHGGEHPAEPSSAFQTHRTGQDHSFGRRRASSNISGGSGAYFRRGSKGADAMPPPDALGARRPSMAGSVGSPHSPHVQPVPGHGQHKAIPPGGWQQGASPSHTFAAPHQATSSQEEQGPPPVMPPGQDDVELQQKIMRESREQARKRRLEEEARLEEEKKERIRKKLESLGPAPEKKSEKQEPQPKVISRPTQIQQRESRDPTQQITEAIKELHQAKPELEAASSAQDGVASKARRPSMNNAGPLPASTRRMSSSQDGKRPDLWSGSGSRPERFPPWGPGAQPTTQAVWGAPNNNRGLGNGTFSTDLNRISDPAGPPAPPGQAPAPIGPPGPPRAAADARPQPQAPIGSRPTRFASSGSDLASKWINGVAETDQKMNAERLAERMQREAQLAERGLSLEDAQPQIKDTWRPVHASEGTRRPIGALDGVPPPPPPNPAGVIGSKSSSVLQQATPGQPSQGRMSRFFPANPSRMDSQDHGPPARSSSPSPPPPTMEDHPAYEGNTMHPLVSLPRPQPRVRLPPSVVAAQAAQAAQNPPQFSWANPGSFSNAVRGQPPPPATNAGPGARRVSSTSQADWQNKFNSLLHAGKATSPPKAMGVDPASRSALDHSMHQDSATVSLPGKAAVRKLTDDPKSTITKPMAEECFEEQEMGSLPQIKIPHDTPEAAWHPATEQTRPFPKRFWVYPTNSEPFNFMSDVSGPNVALKILVPGMKEAKVISVPNTFTRGGRGGHGRPSPRHRGSSGRGGKRESTTSRVERDAPTESSRGRGRGTFRGRGSESWSRQASSTQQTSIST